MNKLRRHSGYNMQASQSVILDIYEQKTFSQMMRGIMICYKEWLVISVSLHKLKCQCTEIITIIVHLSVAKKMSYCIKN